MFIVWYLLLGKILKYFWYADAIQCCTAGYRKSIFVNQVDYLLSECQWLPANTGSVVFLRETMQNFYKSKFWATGIQMLDNSSPNKKSN